MATAGAAPRTASQGGCLKCGETGHWARDCKAPREKWISNKPKDATAGDATQPGAEPMEGNDENARVDGDAAPIGAAAAARQKRQRPKVTFELLKKTEGLPDVYHNFPILFKKTSKGKGHEVSDLRRLLEMYKRWQDRIFPHSEFDEFITKVEKLGNTNIVKKEVQDMRLDLLRAVEAAAEPPEEQVELAEAADIAVPRVDAHVGGNADDDIDLDLEMEMDMEMDDELLELAACPVPETIAAVNGGEEDLLDDDALVELALEGGDAVLGNNNNDSSAGAGDDDVILGLADDLDDEALLDLAMQDTEGGLI